MKETFQRAIPNAVKAGALAVAVALGGASNAAASPRTVGTKVPTTLEDHHKMLDKEAQGEVSLLTNRIARFAMRAVRTHNKDISVTDQVDGGGQTTIDIDVKDVGSADTATPSGEIITYSGPTEKNSGGLTANPDKVNDVFMQTYMTNPSLVNSTNPSGREYTNTVSFTSNPLNNSMIFQSVNDIPYRGMAIFDSATTEPVPGQGESFLGQERFYSALGMAKDLVTAAQTRQPDQIMPPPFRTELTEIIPVSMPTGTPIVK